MLIAPARSLSFLLSSLRRIGTLVLAALLFSPQAHAWWDTNWTKLRPINITWSGASQSNYQVKVVVTYDSAMQSDFDDIRFIDSNATTVLDYWRESYTASTSATFWVEVPSITGNKSIYMYYGNGGVSTTSSGSATFEYYEDFEGMTNGDIDGQSGWVGPDPGHSGTTPGQVTAANAYQGSKQLEHGDSVSGAYSSILSNIGLGNGRMLEFMVNLVDIGGSGSNDARIFVDDADNDTLKLATRPVDCGTNWSVDWPGQSTICPAAVSEGTWERVRIGMTTSNNLFYYIGSTAITENTNSNFSGFDEFRWYQDQNAIVRWDQVFIRKFAGATEPGSSMGCEQSYGSGNGGGSGVVHEETQATQCSSSSSFAVSNVAGGTDQLYLLAVAIYGTGVTVDTVSGGGLTWSPQKSQCSARISNPHVEIWQANGSPGSTFNTYIGLSGSPDRVSAAVSRYSGADMTTPTEGAAGSNTNGQNGACSGGTDASGLSLSLTSSQNDSMLYVASHPRNRTLPTEDIDYDRRVQIINYNGGDGGNLYVHDRKLAANGNDNADHTASGTTDWDMAGLVINPAGGGGSLVSHWTFDEGSGQTAADATANNNDATLGISAGAESEDPTWACVTGGYALSFDGSDDVIEAGSPATLDDLGPMTVAAWIKPASAGAADLGQIFGKSQGSGRWYLEIDNTSPDVKVLEFSKDYDTDVERATVDNTVVFDTWQHVAITWDGTSTGANIHIYKDGVEAGYKTTNNGSGTKYSDAALPFIIGNRGDYAHPFDGLIDDVRVYDYALSSGEISALAASAPVECSPAVTSAVAEISPNDVTTSSTGNAFSYDIDVTIGGGATGVDQVGITVPAGFTNVSVTDVEVDSSHADYTDGTIGNAISVTLDTLVSSSSTITVLFTADAPTSQDTNGVDFLSTVDDTSTGTAAESTTEGDGDGDSGDANTWTVTTTDAGGGFSCPIGSELFSDDFESGNLNAWDGSWTGTGTDSISVSTDVANSGTQSVKSVVDNQYWAQASVIKDINGQTTIHAKTEVYFPSSFSTASDIAVLEFRGNGNNIIAATMNNDMTWFMWNEAAGEGYGTSAAISKDEWHTIEMRVTISDTAGEARLWIDGNLEVTATGKNLGTDLVDSVLVPFYWASPGDEVNTVYADDVAICGTPPAGGTPGNPVVNSTDDDVDASPGDGSCDTGQLNSQSVQECTLRAAIMEANAYAGSDAIDFDIPTSESGYSASPLGYTIALGSSYPAIDDDIVVDGTSQPDFTGSPIIVVNGNNVASRAFDMDSGSEGSTIRGLVIHDFTNKAIDISANDITVVGNFLGTDVTGLSMIDNDISVYVNSGWDSAVIGTSAAADRNVFGGSNTASIVIKGSNAKVQGNYFGIGADGITTLSNGGDNIALNSATNALIGGTNAGEGNLIGNATVGVRTQQDSLNNTIAGNTIFDNDEAGVSVKETEANGNTISQNSFYGNGYVGIDLGDDDVPTANDTGDGDSGFNNLQNFPVLTEASTTGSQVTITGDLNSSASRNFRIEFFANSVPTPGQDGTGYGEGERYLGYDDVTTDGSGDTAINSVLAASVAVGEYVTATATDLTTNDTSEFAQNVTAVSGSLPPGDGAVNSTGDAGDNNTGDDVCDTGNTIAGGDPECTLRAAIQQANATSGANSIGFDIPASDAGYLASPLSWTITPATSLPYPDEQIVIDGSTQPGFAGDPIIVIDGDGGATGGPGIELATGADGSEIRGLVIIGFTTATYHGIRVNTSNNTIAGNWIGLEADGVTVNGNGTRGVDIRGGANNNTVGGTTALDRNVIAGNQDYISVHSSNDNVIIGNYLGTNAAGTAALGSSRDGIRVVQGSTGTIIGGGTVAERNIIAAAAEDGIEIGSTASGTIVQGNYIGTDVNGTADFGNGQSGIQIESAAGNDNLIGGTGANEGNIIAFSKSGTGDGEGIRIEATSDNNAVLGNSIHSNTALGIDLRDAGAGVTENDANDADTGPPNDFLNFPEITSAVVSAGTVDIDFDLDVPAGDYRIEFFGNPSGADGSGNGEGEVYIGYKEITHTGSGVESFSHSFAGSAGDVITATTTEKLAGPVYTSTSEFSDAFTVTEPPAVTSAVAEISPNDVTTSSTGNSISYDITITIGGTDTGVDQVSITVPGSFSISATPVTDVLVNDVSVGAGFTDNTAGNAISVDLTTKVTASSKITILFDADAPTSEDTSGVNFLSTVNDSGTGTAAQSTTEGNGDGDSGDANSWKVTTTDATGSLIGDWQFNDGSGQTAADSSASNNNGTLGTTAGSDGNDPTWACSGTALDFDGNDDEVQLGSLTIGDSAEWTISAWIMVGADTADKRTIYSEGNTVDRQFLFLYVDDTANHIDFYSEDSGAVNTTKMDGVTNVETDTWQLITVVQRSKTDRELYVGTNSEDTSSANAGTLNFDAAQIGRLRTNAVTDPFLGLMDNVRIYDYALSTGEIATLAASPPTGCTTPAVTSAVAEISPTDVTTSSIGNAFSYDIDVTITGGDTGVNQVSITVPGGFTNVAVYDVEVDGTPVAHSDNTVGNAISIDLTAKVTASSRITVLFTADAPTTEDTGGVDFLSTVDDTDPGPAAQSTTEGNGDADAGDANTWTVTTTDSVGGGGPGACPAPNLGGWYPGGWLYRKPLSIGAGSVPSNLANFPVLVSIPADTDLAADAQSDFDDILFTAADGTTKLSHEIEKYNETTGELVAWVKVPFVSASADTIVYMYYGNGAVGSQQDAANVWTTNFKSVWHLKEDPSGSAPQIKDSTSGTNDGASSGSMTSGDQVAGKIDGSLDLDGSNDMVTVTVNDNSVRGLSQATVSAWIYPTNLDSSWQGIYQESRNTDGSDRFAFSITGNKLRFHGRAPDSDSSTTWVDYSVALTPDTWQYVVGVFNADTDTHCVYVNGTSECNNVTADAFSNTAPEDNWTRIGARNKSAGNPFPGQIDEVRISGTARPDDWITAEYNNQNDPANFHAVCGEEVGNPAVTSADAEISPNDVATSSTGNSFSYDIQATIGGGDSGVDRVTITVPGSFSGVSVTDVEVDGTPVAYTDNTSGNDISVDLTTKVTSSSKITVLFDADAPTSQDLTGVDFISTVDDSVTAEVAQATTEGNGDGDAGDADSWTVTTTDAGGTTPLYRSVGTTATNLNTTPRTVEIAGATATFSGAMPDNVGVGDVLTYNNGSNQLAFISGRTNSTEYTVVDKNGGTPATASAGTAVGVYRAYTSLSNWEAGTENGNITEPTEDDVNPSTDLVTTDTVMMVAAYGDGTDTANLVINGWNTGPSNYIRIYTPVTSSEVGTSQRHAGAWDTGKYHIDAAGKVIDVREEYVRIEGLQIRQTSVSGNGDSGIIVEPTGTSEHHFSHNIIRGVTISGFWHVGIEFYQVGANSVTYIWNNIIYDFGDSTYGYALNPTDPDLTSYIYNNTMYNNGNGILEDTGSGVAIAKNNIAFGHSGSDYSGMDSGSDNNLGEDSAFGADANYVQTSQTAAQMFVDPTGSPRDLHILSTSDAYDAGADLSGDSNWPFVDEIDGGTRPAGAGWDIGADESGAAGPSGELVGHWDFDEGTGQSVGDATANSNDGTLGPTAGAESGDPAWACVAGGYALDFDGSDDRVFVAYPGAPWDFADGGLDAGTGDFSIAAWIRYDASTPDSFPSIVFKGGGSDTSAGYWFAYEKSVDGFRLNVSDGTLRFIANSNVTVGLTDEQWHHLTGVFDREAGLDTAYFYLDGNPIGSESWDQIAGNSVSGLQDFGIGARGSDGNRPWQGGIDDVRIYDYTLSAGEISALAASPPVDCAPAVTSAVAEISPNDVTTSSTANAFSYDIQVTIGGSDTGVDTVAITVPGSFGAPTIVDVEVDGTPVTYNNNTSGQAINVELTTKVTASSKITVLFTADAPTTQDAGGVDFLSSVDDSGTGDAAQATTEGNGDGDGGDNDSWTVTTTDSGGGACIAIDGTASTGTTETQTLQISHATSGTDRLMLVGISIDNNNYETVSSVTYNSVPLTFVGADAQDNDARVEIWQLTENDGLTTGTHNVDITFSANLGRPAVAGVLTFTGVDQTTPLGTFASDANTSNSASVTVSSAVGELVYAVMSTEDTASVTTDAPANEQWHVSIAGGGNTEWGVGATDDGAASVDMSWSLGSSDYWAAGGVSIKSTSSCGNAAVTSAVAEISPNDVVTSSTGNAFSYDIDVTIGGGDTGVDTVNITVPGTFGAPTITGVQVNSGGVAYTNNTSGNDISIDLTTPVTSSSRITVLFTADAPTSEDPTGVNFTSTVDDSGTGSAAQATTEGNGDGDSADNDSWTVTTTIGGSCPASSIIFADDFESGNLNAWDSIETDTGDSVTASTAQSLSGSWSAKAEVDNQPLARARMVEFFADKTTVSARVYFYLDPAFSISTSSMELIYFDAAGATQIITASINSNMTLRVWNEAGNEAYSSSSTVSKGVWHSMELQAVVNGTTSQARLWLDGNLEVNATGIDLGTNPLTSVTTGWHWSSVDDEPNIIYVDDVVVCDEPMGTVPNSSKVLIIASDSSSPNSSDLALQAYLEGLGLTIFYADDDDAEYETAIAANNIDVVYISSSAFSSKVDFAKVASLSVGAVNANNDNNDDLDLGGNDTNDDPATTVNLIDNTHFITSGMSTGNFAAYSSGARLIWGGSYGSGAQVLAQNPSNASEGALVAFDTGDLLDSGTPAPARRVGTYADADFSVWTDDTKTIIYRSLIWAGGNNGGGGSCDIDPGGTYIEAENYTPPLVPGSGSGVFGVQTSLGAYNGTGYTFTTNGSTGTPPVNERADYPVNFTATGTYYVWQRGYGVDGSSDSVFFGLDGTWAGALNDNGVTDQWNWSNTIQDTANTINVASTGAQTINLWVREANHGLDGIYITQDSGAIPGGPSTGIPTGATVLDPNNCSSGPAVTSAVAEISPTDVATSSTANQFYYDIQATVDAGDTGVNLVTVTVPAGFTNVTVADVEVNGSPVAFTDNTVGNAISVDLTLKVTSSSKITVLFTADAPTSQDLTGVDFLSTVDDSSTGDAVQDTTEGNGDGDSGDANTWTVTTTDAPDSVTSASAEISPNNVTTSSVANAFSYDINVTIGGGDTGVNRVTVTVPGTFGAPTVTDVEVDSSPVAYTDNTSGNDISVDLTTKVTSSGRITVLFTVDAPTTQDLVGVNVTSTVDDSATPASAKSTTQGNGDGDAGDNNSWVVTTTDPGGYACPIQSNLFSDGFETGNLSAWDGSNTETGDSISASTDEANTDSYALKSQVDTVTDAQAMIWKNINGQTEIQAKVELFLPSGFSISDHMTFLQFLEGWNNVLALTIDDDRTFYMWNAVAGEAYGYQATPTVSTNAWHTFEMRATISDTVGEARVWLDGNLEITATGLDLGTNPIDRVATGWYWSAPRTDPNTTYIDDFALCGVPPSPAATSAVAEISPNDVTTNSTGNSFSYDIDVTISGGDTGVDTVAITVPGNFGTPNVTDVLVDSSPVAYTDYTAGYAISVELGTKLAADAQITVLFDADAPASQDLTGANFLSTVDDSGSVATAQATTEGNGDGNAGDNNSWTVTTTDGALTAMSRWMLDETSGTNAADANAGHDGTYANGVTLNQGGACGNTGTSVYFGGEAAGQYVVVPHDDDYLLDDGTISLWVNLDEVPNAGSDGEHGLFSKDSLNRDNGGHLDIRILPSGAASTRMQTTTVNHTVDGDTVTPGTWTHIAFSWGSGGMKLYVDGGTPATDAYTGGLATTSGGSGNYEPVTLGASQLVSDPDLGITPLQWFLKGYLDDVRVYGSELTLAEIQYLAACEAANAATSAVAEITPNDVTTSSTGNAFSYDVDATITGISTGVNTVAITVPGTFGVPTVTDVLVDGFSVPYTDNTSGHTISVVLTSKVTSSSRITVLFAADAPIGQDLTGVDFVSTVDDSGTGDAAQATTEGNGDGDSGDNNSWTVTTTGAGGGGPVNPVVNSTGDTGDNGAGDGVCDTGGLNSQSATECTLRAAIQEANANSGIDTISFNMPTSETGYSGSPLSYTIVPGSALPGISDQVVIDGTTQPGYGGTPIVIVDGNSIGASGFVLAPNGDNSTIRGLIIRDFGVNGIQVQAGSDGNLIAGNYIGRLNASGTDASVGNRNDLRGIEVLGDDTTIGGTTAADRNVISGNGSEGIFIASGATDTIVRGNYIGTEADGTTALGNEQEGIQIDGGSPGTIIGGSAAGAGNVIGANGISSGAGISIDSDDTDNTIVQGNYIGTDASGTADIGNIRSGVEIRGSGSAATSPLNTLIGGINAGEGNVIRFNDLDGVRVRDVAIEVAILGNTIYGNDDIGIDLWPSSSDDDVTANDSGDGDSGANELLNFPVITQAIGFGGNVDINFDADLPTGNYRVEFFKNPAGADGSGNGEGQTFIDFVNIAHTGSGTESFSHSFSGVVGDTLTATVTEELSGPTFRNSSEFSASYVVTAGAAVAAAVAEIDPNDVTTNAGQYLFSYDINATIGAANTGVDRVAITVPGTFGVYANPVTNVLVDGISVAFTDNTVGNAISIDLTSKITTSARITILFNADAPTGEDLTGVDFLSTVDDSTTGDAAQDTTEGNGDGDTQDADSWTVTTTDLPTGGGTGSCPITVDGVVDTGTRSSGNSQMTISHTTSGINRLMLVGISFVNDDYEEVDYPGGVTYNGDPLTRVGWEVNHESGGDDGRVEIWALVAPDTGTHDVVINFDDPISEGAIAGVMTFNGVDQTTPLGSFAKNDNDGSTSSVSVASAADELVFAIMAGETTGYPSANSPSDERWSLSRSNSYGGGATRDGSSGNVTVSFSHGSDHWVAAGVSIKPAQTCGGTDHFSITDNNNTSCSAETMTIAAHSATHSVDTSYTGLVRLSTSTDRGDWVLVSGNGTLNTSDNGHATYFYDAADNGEVVLSLLSNVPETVNIDATNGSDTEDSGEDPDFVFTSAGGTTTFRDEFNSVAYDGDDGTSSWSSDWIELASDGGPGSGDTRISSDNGSNRLRVRDNDDGGEGAYRQLDLSGMTSATLSFDYRRDNLSSSFDYVTIDISANGGSSWTELDRFEGSGTDGSYSSVNYDISSYMASNTRIRFKGSTNLGGDEQIYFDNVEIVAQTGGACGGASINHFAIVHDGTGINCQAEPVTIEAHDAGHNVVTSYAGVVKLATSTSHGDWSLITGSGAVGNSGNGGGSYAFDSADNGSVTLGLRDTFIETVNIDAADVNQNEDAGEDDDLAFARAGFNFLANSAKNTIGVQIAGKPSNVAPGNQTLEIQAVKTNDDTGACEAALTGSNAIDIAFECEDPTTCAAIPLSFSGTNLPANADNAVLSYTGINMDFGSAADDTATFTLSYPDVGKVKLHARTRLMPSGEAMQGASNSFVVRPFAFDIDVSGNPAATGPGDAAFIAAGTNFTADVTALLWDAADDLDNDGIADNHDDTDPSNNADLTDNGVALNYGKEYSIEQVLLTATLDQPSGGVNPGLSGGTNLTIFTDGTGTTTTLRYDEVGIIEVSAKVADNNYLGIGATETAKITSKSGYVGRFHPAQYAVTASDINPACSATFTYARQPFTGSMTIEAQNGDDGGNTRTQNYRAGFVTLDPNSELTFINSQTAGAYNSKTVTYNQNFDSGNTGEAILALQFRWDMPEQPPAISTVQNTAVTDEVTTLVSAPVTIGSSPTRYGRAFISTAAGSELVDLDVAMRTEYYLNSTNGYVVNVEDFCSAGAVLSLSNFTDNLSAGETCVQDTGSPGLSGAGCATSGPVLEQYNDPLTAGDANLFLKAPGAGNDGSAIIDADVPDWLEFDWDVSVPGLEDPSGHVTFGIYGGDKNQIYRRELY